MTARVLIVDESGERGSDLERRLDDEFFEVSATVSGDAAIEMAQRDAPDLVLLGCPAGAPDAWETCRRLKADPATAHIPVVMLTRHDQPAARLRGLAVGADDFLVEPVGHAELVARVRSLVRLKTLLDEIRSREPAAALPTPAELGDADTRATIAIIDDGSPRIVDLIAMLRGFGTVVTVAFDRAAERLRRARCDLVVAALGDGDVAALRLVSRLRSHAETRHLPLLAFVPRSDNAMLVKAFEVGASDCVAMPADMLEVIARVRTLLRRNRLTERMRQNLLLSMRLATTDAVTGAYNRHYLAHQLAALTLRARTTGRPLAALMVDIDHFKRVNDRHGHATGDRALRAVAHELASVVRGLDIVARYGGEEFVVLMPDSDLEAARRVADRVRAAVETLDGRSPGLPAMTVSIGVAVYVPGVEPGAEPADLIPRADAALYAAKRGGRNRVEPAPQRSQAA